MTTPDDRLKAGISALRTVIDDIDLELLELINRRLATAKKIGRIKSLERIQVQDRSRERQVLNRLEQRNRGPLKPDDLHHLFMEIIGLSRDIQHADAIAFLGPEASLTHYAALQHFGHNTPVKPLQSLPDVFRDVERGSSRCGVVPLEHAVEGAVTSTLDLFFASTLLICGERYLTATHDLLVKDGSLPEVRTIYTHPHAAALCRGWLRKHLPDAEIRECRSTADAAARAAGQPGAAAIGGSAAAHVYRLTPLVSSIEDHRQHPNRFLILGREEVQPTGNDKTSLLFVTANRPGALYRALKPLDDASVNMLKLESRPFKQENWNHLFFADLAGHSSEPAVARAVERMQGECLHLKFLGAYPAAPLDGTDREAG